MEGVEGGGEGEDEHAEEGGDGGSGDGGVAAEVGVADEGADDGGEVAGAGEDVEERGSGDAGHVVHRRQVHQHVRQRPDRPKFLKCLVPYDVWHGLPSPVVVDDGVGEDGCLRRRLHVHATHRLIVLIC